MNDFLTNNPLWAIIIGWLLSEILNRAFSKFFGLKFFRSLRTNNLVILTKEINFLIITSLFSFVLFLFLYFSFTQGTINQNTIFIMFFVLIGVLFFQTLRIIISIRILANNALDLGVAGFDREIKSGVNYDKTLQESSKSIAFLGIGANKLINSESFESAIARCYESSGRIAEWLFSALLSLKRS